MNVSELSGHLRTLDPFALVACAVSPDSGDVAPIQFADYVELQCRGEAHNLYSIKAGAAITAVLIGAQGQ